jgi:hypothetical protein
MPAHPRPNPPPQHAPAVAQDGRYQVRSPRAEVMFHCGQAIGLYLVAVDGHLQPHLRALRHANVWAVFDLRHLASEIADDMLRLQPRDHPGLVFYSLRGAYPTRDAFMVALSRNLLHGWREAPPAQAVLPLDLPAQHQAPHHHAHQAVHA